MRTPFLGGAYVSRSKNLADQELLNLYPEIVETKSGKDVGAFYMCPGLDLLATCGNGPVRGVYVFNGTLYVVSANGVYSVSPSYAVMLLGYIGTSDGPVSIIANTTQVAIFDGTNGYLIPGGYPLSGGTIGAGGTAYAIGDTIYLDAIGGSQTATATVTITGSSGGVPTSFSIATAGAFPTQPTSFIQNTTSGSGSGFTITSPTYGAFQGVYLLSLPFSGPVSASYQDGFGLVNVSGTQEWYQSDLNDLSIWDPLNFTSAVGLPTDVIAIAESHLEQWILKSDSVEIWVNAGLPGFAFQAVTGVFIEVGIAAPFSVAKAGEALMWLTQNDQGQGQIVRANGYRPDVVSTHSIDREIATYPIISDAIAFAYQQEGHLFYVITFPSGNATWVYDVTASAYAGVPMWHRRGAFLAGKINRHWANCYAFFQSRHVVGDYLTGNLYALDLDTQTDNGAQRKWLRSWRALPKPSEEPIRFNSLQIDMQTGIGVPDGTNPQCVLRWSDDGGHIWSEGRQGAVGPPGKTAQRVKFNRLGSTRRNSGLDRIFELSSTDAFSVALIGAILQ